MLSTAFAYSVVFDALDKDDRSSIMTTIADDIGDIYADLMDGLMLHAGRHGDAIWSWQFSYWQHWGRYAVHAQSAIYSYLAGGNWNAG